MGVYERLQKKLREVLAEAMALANRRMVIARGQGDEAKVAKYRNALYVLEKLDIAMGVSAKPIAATSALSAEEFGKVSWALSLGDFENPKARKKGTFGVWVRNMAREGHLPEDHPGIELAGALFGDALTKVGAEYEIKVFLGHDIPRMYEEMHEHLRSCMTSDGRLVELWGLNPEKVALVVAFRNERPLARALLWREVEGRDEDGNEFRFSTLDRVYASEEGARDALKEWARRNGYGVRSHDDYYEFEEGRWFELPGGTKIKHAQVELKRSPHTYWPYADSFKYLMHLEDDRCVLATTDEWGESVGILQRTDGRYEPRPQYVYCDRCGERMEEDDAYHSNEGDGPYCYSCYNEIYVACERCGCETDREYAYLVEGDWLCERCYEQHAGYCERCDEGFYSENLVYVSEEDITLCHSCYYRYEREREREEVRVEG